MAQRFYISIDDLTRARGEHASLSFTGDSPASLAAALQAALREPALWQRWRDLQDDPDEVDPSTGATDPSASVTGELVDSRGELVVTTSLPHAIVKHRLDLLAGRSWTLRDVKGA